MQFDRNTYIRLLGAFTGAADLYARNHGQYGWTGLRNVIDKNPFNQMEYPGFWYMCKLIALLEFKIEGPKQVKPPRRRNMLDDSSDEEDPRIANIDEHYDMTTYINRFFEAILMSSDRVFFCEFIRTIEFPGKVETLIQRTDEILKNNENLRSTNESNYARSLDTARKHFIRTYDDMARTKNYSAHSAMVKLAQDIHEQYGYIEYRKLCNIARERLPKTFWNAYE